ncbi:MAG TPA: energy-coupling factor transporter transmembrane component T [bacterium]|nr:energy-coupling factor transporter transmembrane component T [bacterium]
MNQPPLKRLHPATRLALLVLTLVLLTTFNHPAYVTPLVAGVTLAALYLCGAGTSLRRTAPLAAAFVVLSALLWPPFIKTGEPWAHVWVYRATNLGVLYGLAVGLRTVGMLVAGLAFLAVTTPEEFSEALRTYRVPRGATVTLTLAFRLLPVMFETSARALEAQRARGLDFGSSFLSQARRALPLVVPVFLYSLRSADQLATSLELRGYHTTKRPTPYGARPASAWDWGVWTAMVAVVAAAVFIRLSGHGAVLPGRL